MGLNVSWLSTATYFLLSFHFSLAFFPLFISFYFGVLILLVTWFTALGRYILVDIFGKTTEQKRFKCNIFSTLLDNGSFAATMADTTSLCIPVEEASDTLQWTRPQPALDYDGTHDITAILQLCHRWKDKFQCIFVQLQHSRRTTSYSPRTDHL